MGASWFEALALPGVILILITSTALYLVEDAVWSVALLAMQAVGVFILTGREWQFALALSVLIAGWIAAAILWQALYTHQQEISASGRSDQQALRLSGSTISYGSALSAIVFRLLAVVLVGLGSVSALPALASWAPGIAIESAIGAVFLIGLGLFQLGLTNHPMRVIMGLIAILWGFTLIYADVEKSALVAGLLAFITMGLALLGVYFIFQSSMEQS